MILPGEGLSGIALASCRIGSTQGPESGMALTPDPTIGNLERVYLKEIYMC